ncbi:MAG: PLD nuclease N-terminal domain-containing protein [Bacteroidetes bacterium]|nr:PLD nuclease N-terminal domain-containing protein [Bacteroidota bacterium]
MIHQVLPPSILTLCALFIAGCEPRLLTMADSWQSLSCCGLIILILDVIAIVEILGSSRSAVRKIVWIVFILFAPFLGLICYYIFADRS